MSRTKIQLEFGKDPIKMHVTVNGLAITELMRLTHQLELDAAAHILLAKSVSPVCSFVVESSLRNVVQLLLAAVKNNVQLAADITGALEAYSRTDSSMQIDLDTTCILELVLHVSSSIALEGTSANVLGVAASVHTAATLADIMGSTALGVCTDAEHMTHVTSKATDTLCAAQQVHEIAAVELETNGFSAILTPLQEIADEKLTVYAAKPMFDWFYKYVD